MFPPAGWTRAELSQRDNCYRFSAKLRDKDREPWEFALEMNMQKQLLLLGSVFGFLVSIHSPVMAAEVKVRLGTLAPKGSSYAKHLQAMGEKWRKAPGGGAV